MATKMSVETAKRKKSKKKKKDQGGRRGRDLANIKAKSSQARQCTSQRGSEGVMWLKCPQYVVGGGCISIELKLKLDSMV